MGVYIYYIYIYIYFFLVGIKEPKPNPGRVPAIRAQTHRSSSEAATEVSPQQGLYWVLVKRSYLSYHIKLP